jgi:hypothetical protein
MKKQQLVATLGTLALAANLLLPGLALGQGAANQTGSAAIGCNSSLSFTLTPASTFSFYSNGSSTAIASSLTAQNAFNNPNGAALTVTDTNDFIQVEDLRDPTDVACGNNGLTLTVNVADQTAGGADGRIFDSSPLVNDVSGTFIPLEDLFVLSDNQTCASVTNYNNSADTICFDTTAICGDGTGTATTNCQANANQGVNTNIDSGAISNNYATIGNFDAYFGTGNTIGSALSVFEFSNGWELYGKAGVGVSYAVHIPAAQPAGVYQADIVYTLAATP